MYGIYQHKPYMTDIYDCVRHTSVINVWHISYNICDTQSPLRIIQYLHYVNICHTYSYISCLICTYGRQIWQLIVSNVNICMPYIVIHMYVPSYIWQIYVSACARHMSWMCEILKHLILWYDYSILNGQHDICMYV